MTPLAPPRPASSSIFSQISAVKSQITPTQRLWLLSLGIVLSTLLIGAVMIQFPWQEHRQRLAARYKEEKERSELLLAIQRQKTELKSMEDKFLLEGGSTSLAGQISQLAAQSGLQIESVTPHPELISEPYTRFQIEIIAASSLANTLRFLKVLEDHRPLFWVEQMDMGEPRAESSSVSADKPGEFQPRKQQKVRFLISAVSRQKNPG